MKFVEVIVTTDSEITRKPASVKTLLVKIEFFKLTVLASTAYKKTTSDLSDVDFSDFFALCPEI